MLEDIAAVTGGQVITEKTGMKFENAELSMLGRASKIIATKDKTVIVGGKGGKKSIDARITQLRKQIADTTSKFDKEKLQERVAKLSRRCCRYTRRRCDRDRDEGEEAPRRGRAAGCPCGPRGGLRFRAAVSR